MNTFKNASEKIQKFQNHLSRFRQLKTVNFLCQPTMVADIFLRSCPPYNYFSAVTALFYASLRRKKETNCLVEIYWWYFFIWEHGEELLIKFLNEINSIHQTMKFTADWSKQKINFVDVDVNLKNGVLSINLFVKPTVLHQFLYPTSCHSFQCRKEYPLARE